MKTATPSLSPATVPTRDRFGCSGTGGGGGGGAGRGAGCGTLATTGAGGRRDGVNSGGLRVAASALNGIAQSGLALGAAAFCGSAAGCGDAPGVSGTGFAVISCGGMAWRVTSSPGFCRPGSSPLFIVNAPATPTSAAKQPQAAATETR